MHVCCASPYIFCTYIPVGIKCEKSRHQLKDAKRAEKMRKEPFYGRKDRLCYVELDFDRTDIIKSKCQ